MKLLQILAQLKKKSIINLIKIANIALKRMKDLMQKALADMSRSLVKQAFSMTSSLCLWYSHISLWLLCVLSGDLPQGVGGGSVWRIREYEPGSVRCSEHPLRNKVWSRS